MGLFNEQELSGSNKQSEKSVRFEDCMEINIDDEYSLYLAISGVREYGSEVGLNDVQLQETEIALRELVNNILKHGGGVGVVRLSKGDDSLTIEVEDWGQGVSNFLEAMEDGYTTGGGLGGGLPAVNRLMDSFRLISRPKGGALFRAVKNASIVDTNAHSRWHFSVFSRPKTSENFNGDGYFLRRNGKSTFIALVDGLGHGTLAHISAQRALRYIEQYYHWNEVELIKLLHEKLRGTRGVVLGIVKIGEGLNKIRYTGVGNIYGLVFRDRAVNFINYNGTLGVRIRKVKTMEYETGLGDLLILHTDGINSHWLQEFNNLWSDNLIDFSQQLINNYSRTSDDATVIVGWRQ